VSRAYAHALAERFKLQLTIKVSRNRFLEFHHRVPYAEGGVTGVEKSGAAMSGADNDDTARFGLKILRRPRRLLREAEVDRSVLASW
jgi:hypothetical protein